MRRQDCALPSLAGLVCVLFGGCFSPNVTDDSLEDGGSAATSSSAGTTSSPDNETSTGGGTGSNPGTSATSSAETTNPTSESTSGSDTPGSSGTAGENSYCGDGVVDDGEECDDGLEANGLDQSCLPDCNLNTCGDGNVGPSEACDEGADDNVLEPGACAPDCSGTIQTREIVVSEFGLEQEDGNFGANPLATADAMCEAGYNALFAVPGQRQVTNTPNLADAVVDWPLQPYTAYVNDDGELLWVTDSAPLLGVRDGIPAPLLNTIMSGGFAVTGMNTDWTANTAENCSNFSSSSSTVDLRYGLLYSDDAFLSGFVTTPCNDTSAAVICVEL